MDEKGKNSRSKKVFDDVLDAGADELGNAATRGIRMIIQDISDWLINKYNESKSGSDENTEERLENLRMQIDILSSPQS